MLIRDAEIWDGPKRADVRITDGRIAAIGTLRAEPGEPVHHAGGGALLPGLHDHHLHLCALAAALASVRCGPPHVMTAAALATALAAAPGTGWVRGIGYHDSVAGDIDRHWLDRAVSDRPVRVQHRGGRQWILNSMAIDLVLSGADTWPEGMERVDDRPTGRVREADDWLRVRLGGEWPDLDRCSRLLASYGVTGVTDMTPANNDESAAHFARQQRSGRLRQSVLIAGRPTLTARTTPDIAVLATKFHLHESNLPEYDAICRRIAASHAAGRPVAIHCVTRTELVFALAAIAEAGPLRGDRIEHASVAPDDLIAWIQDLGLGVVSQPNFIAERGDAYLDQVAPADIPWLYRARGFISHGIPFAGGTDAPFGDPDPWRAMRAAVDRRTAHGATMDREEAVPPEEAIRLFLAEGSDIARQRRIAAGEPANLCLLRHPWRTARDRLDAGLVHLTLRAGRPIHEAAD